MNRFFFIYSMAKRFLDGLLCLVNQNIEYRDNPMIERMTIMIWIFLVNHSLNSNSDTLISRVITWLFIWQSAPSWRFILFLCLVDLLFKAKYLVKNAKRLWKGIKSQCKHTFCMNCFKMYLKWFLSIHKIKLIFFFFYILQM